MHALFFDMKHAHLSALRFSRSEAALVGLTPARVDMLRAIGEWASGISQKVLRRSLCVSAATVSIMVRALENLGFVTRRPDRLDARTSWVQLTGQGKRALRSIFCATVSSGFWRLAFTCIFGRIAGVPGRGWDLAMSRLETKLARFRRRVGIGSHNPWCWNDDDEAFYYDDVPGNPVRTDLAPSVAEREARDPKALKIWEWNDEYEEEDRALEASARAFGRAPEL